MAVNRSGVANANESGSSTNISIPSENPLQSSSSGQTHLSSPHQCPSYKINVLPEMVALSPLYGTFNESTMARSLSQSTIRVPSPQPESHSEAGPLPQKVGEIGYVRPAEPTSLPDSAARNLSPTQNQRLPSPRNPRDHDSFTEYLHAVRSPSEWSPGVSTYEERNRGSLSKPREKITASKLLLRPCLLASLGLMVLIITFVGFLQVQERINNNNEKKNHSNNPEINEIENHTGNPPINSSDPSAGTSSSTNTSFVYLGTIFIVALLIEFWVFVGILRRLYHRLGLWIDQEYPILLPDLSDPDATIPPTPVLPLWAKMLGIRPQAVRAPLLPPYMAVLNMIRNGRSEVNLEGTGDVEDGEVIRTLAIGQGQAAPAFNGEEFQKSTIILSGPPKRNSISSTVPSDQSTGGLLRNLSRTFTNRFGSRSSPSAIQEIPASQSSQQMSEIHDSTSGNNLTVPGLRQPASITNPPTVE